MSAAEKVLAMVDRKTVVEAYEKHSSELFKLIEKELGENPLVKEGAKRTGLPVGKFVVYASLSLLAFILFGFGMSLLCAIVGFAFPMYASFKALESEGKEDDTQWLVYWVVYAFVNLFEEFEFFIRWIPAYFLVKIVFLLWLQAPQTRGASFIYRNFLHQYLAKAVAEVDKKKAEVINKAASMRE